MSEARLIYNKDGAVARILFDNPSQHNALTHQMWCDLRDVNCWSDRRRWDRQQHNPLTPTAFSSR